MSSSMMRNPMMRGGQAGRSAMSKGMGKFTTTSPFDAQFIDQMSMHHRGAIASTQAMIAASSRPKLRGLAQDIITTQREQLARMAT